MDGTGDAVWHTFIHAPFKESIVSDGRGGGKLYARESCATIESIVPDGRGGGKL